MCRSFAPCAAVSRLQCMAALAAGLFASSARVGKEPRVKKYQWYEDLQPRYKSHF
jgi:hypothetical protein